MTIGTLFVAFSVVALVVARLVARRALDRIDLAVRVGKAISVLRLCYDEATLVDLRGAVAQLAGVSPNAVSCEIRSHAHVAIVVAGASGRQLERVFAALRPHVAPWLQLTVTRVTREAHPAAPPWRRS